MQITETRLPIVETVTVCPSPIIELHWALLAASDESRRMAQPLLVNLYEDKSLLEGVTSLWDSEPSCFPELVVLAHLAQVMAADTATALRAIGQVAQEKTPALPLRTETPADRQEILLRLERLRSDSAFLGKYLATLGKVWDRIADEIGNRGTEIVSATITSIGPNDDWRQLLRASCADIEPWIEMSNEWIGPSDPVLIVPAYLSGRALLIDLPGQLLVGIKAIDNAPNRADFDALGRTLKSIADPTRLAILARAAAGPVLVGELACALDLSQPTVSNHVKLLRNAGVLVEHHGERGRRELVLDRAAFEALSGSLVSEVLGGIDTATH